MFTKLTHNDLEVIQGGAVCLMPNVNNKEGDPFKGTLVPAASASTRRSLSDGILTCLCYYVRTLI